MRARAAYIHSFGTTSILVASALLMLTVVSAIVAFKGWPAAGGSTDVQSVPLEPSPARAAKVVHGAVAVQGSAGAAGSIASGVVAERRRSPVLGLVKVVSGRGPATVNPAPRMSPAPSHGAPGPAPAPGPVQGRQSPPASSPLTAPADPAPQPVQQLTGTVEAVVPPAPIGWGPGGATGLNLPFLP